MIHVRIPIELPQMWVPSNPRGAERLVPSIVVPHSDLYLRRMYGKPSDVIILYHYVDSLPYTYLVKLVKI